MGASAAIVLATTSFPMQGDGSEAAGAFIADLAQELALGGPVRVVAPGPVQCREVWTEQITVYRYAAPDRPLSTLRIWNPFDVGAIIRTLRNGQRATDAAVQAGPVGRILALWALPCGYWARRASRCSRTRYSVWALGSDIWSLGRLPVVRGVLKSVLENAEHVFADGLQLAEETSSIFGGHVEFLPSSRNISLRTEKTYRTAPPYRLLFIGRWHTNKGADLLMEALERLDEDDWRHIESVELYGGGPLRIDLEAGFRRLRNSSRQFQLLGYLDKTQAAQALLRCDYLMIPSRKESIPVVFSDAMKTKCAVIAMPVGDLPRLVKEPDECGILAEEVTASGYADAIRRAIRTSPARFAEGISRKADLFNLKAVAARIRQSGT